MRLQNEESRHHRMKGLGKKRVISTEEFSESDHIVVALSHLSSVDGDHVVVKPVSDRSCLVANGTLRNFTFMVREKQIHSTSVNVELRAEILGCHSRA